MINQCRIRGIDHFFLAPGSRCTPLTLAVARQNDVQVVQHFDERGLAFAALGYGKATGRPGVFICTSGTAVANAYPAVIEAAMEGIPLLLFTADRPSELRGTGANQTIDQRNIFGNYPKLFMNMPVPEDQSSDEDPSGEIFLIDALEKCFDATVNGPVQLNWMFREPFTIPKECEHDQSEEFSNQVVTTKSPELEPLRIEVRGNVLIALGSCRPDEAAQAQKLSQQLNCPMLTDITSGLRTGSFELPSEFSLPVPDTILQLGGRIVSKSWIQWTESLRNKGTDYVHLASTDQTINPNRLPQKQYLTPLIDLTSIVSGAPTSDDFLSAWQNAAGLRDEVLRKQLRDASQLTEPAIANHLCESCPDSHGLFVGNSMPIRDMDWYGTSDCDHPRWIVANRGASGIDGLLATATGFAVGREKPTTIVLGDLSALHDLNSLALISRSRVPIIVLIINNQGGHIFDMLPIRSSEHFEQFFATPHSFQFEHAAKMFGISYRRIAEMSDFRESYKDALSQSKSVVMELMTNRQSNLETRQQLREEIGKCNHAG